MDTIENPSIVLPEDWTLYHTPGTEGFLYKKCYSDMMYGDGMPYCYTHYKVYYRTNNKCVLILEWTPKGVIYPKRLYQLRTSLGFNGARFYNADPIGSAIMIHKAGGSELTMNLYRAFNEARLRVMELMVEGKL
jgi:hypothetical protein